ncbi:MAG TPA: DUF3179 domain-containing protein [Vicinamibacteria bacterium]|nr:DUF3179 domain-containing protein [Vicinamibacteria bacterium]
MLRAAVLLLAAAVALPGAAPEPERASPAPDIRLFFLAAGADEKEARRALEAIEDGWRDGYAALFLDIMRFIPPAPRRRPSVEDDELAEAGPDAATPPPFRRGGRMPEAAAPVPPGARVRARLVRFLEKQTRQRLGDDLGRFQRWLWNRPYDPHPEYAAFKAALYGNVDPRMASFFRPGGTVKIRLDEIVWGGVSVNGIPPLDRPAHVPAAEATYLDDDDVVFGIALGGEARAYPKRILAWHELARDRLGGVDLAIVYCTLCGTVIPYGAEVGGERRTFGTSGLLYRSNKLMFDEESMSLWSTVEGRPVVGPLAGRDLELSAHPVVTTRWGEWKSRHPHTTVLSLETGHQRDYSEGAAYRDYFATDRLMFGVPRTDERLRNKDEVLTLLLRPRGEGPAALRRPLALSARFLARNPVHHVSFAGHDLVVVTSPGGANRVFEAGGRRFLRLGPGGYVEDSEGRRWRVGEDALAAYEAGLPRLSRVAARRAFWFGWYAQFPQTELVK